METTNDGFKISEADFEIRGPGEFFGEKQSGMPDLKTAHLVYDKDLLKQARDDAFALLNSDPRITSYNVCYTKLLRDRDGRRRII